MGKHSMTTKRKSSSLSHTASMVEGEGGCTLDEVERC